jgi:LysR family hydrogen peroxide-inducible transcriptional activator
MPLTSIRQLQCVVALAETLHFRRAAERCGISQPSFSAQIQAIEGELGVQLFERNRSRVVPTPIGREVAERARRTLAEIRGIEEFVAGVSTAGLAGTIRLGVKPTLGPYLLPHIVSVLHGSHPELKLYVRECAPREMEGQLERGDHDVVLAQLPVASRDVVVERLFREPLYLALARDHPLAEHREVHISDLEGLKILSLAPQYHLSDRVSELCREVGATLELGYEGTSLDALRSMVGMGMGATLLPALYARSELNPHSEVVVRPLVGRSMYRSVGLVWRRSAGRATAYKAIADVIRSVVRRRFRELTLES